MNTVKKPAQRYLFLGCLLLSFFLTGCFQKQSDANAQADFDAFLEQVFVTEVQKDGISLNYSLSHPENYGIDTLPATLGEYSQAAFQKDLASMENYLSTLETFPYRQLTKSQQLTYDILKNRFEHSLEGADFFLYQGQLSKTIGLQAQLPILFAEYHFSDKASVDNYLALLSDVERYYGQILAVEEQKIKNGLFMSHATAADVISQCKNFIQKTENNLLIEVFNDRLETVKGLSDAEKEAYRKQNRDIVLNSVIPAYKNLISFLTQYEDSGVNNGGLCYLPDGKAYYQYLVSGATGSSKTIKEIDGALDNCLKNAIYTMRNISSEEPSILDEAQDVDYPMTEPKEILTYLEDAVLTDYPALKIPVDYSIKYVHESLQPDVSPAFYLTPPIDDTENNSIYINPYQNYNQDRIFTTLAHEGYPGHLYQNVYFYQTSPAPVRSLVNYSGYSEGWATYVEMDSYYLSGIDKTLAKFLRANNLATLCMYGKIDVGVNYYGWDLEKTTTYLEQFGVTDADAAKEIYRAMIAEPGNYLNYILGCIEFLELRQTAQKKLGENFNLRDFHEFILSTGPADFDVLGKQMKTWMKNYS